MRAWKRDGTYEWVGYYLPAPCHKDDSWSGRRQHLIDNGWGLAVIYVGQQTWGKMLPSVQTKTSSKAKSSRRSKSKHRASVRAMTRKSAKPVATKSDRCSVSYVGAAQGQLAQGGQVALAEELLQRLGRLLRHVDLALLQASQQVLGREGLEKRAEPFVVG